MGAPLKWTLIITSLLLLGSRRQTRPISRSLSPPLTLETSALVPSLQQSDEQFSYKVVSRALDRSADGNRLLDTLFFALMAAQATLYTIILDKAEDFAAPSLLLLWGFILAALGTSLTLLVRDGPDPQSFATEFPSDPKGTRSRYVNKYVALAKRNERLHAVKVIALMLAVAMTIGPFIFATVSRAHGV